MTALKITDDILLVDLFMLLPEAREVLKDYGYKKIQELDIEDVVSDKLSLRGFLKLMEASEEDSIKIIKQIQDLYNRKLEES